MNRKINIIIKPVGNLCNLKCDYCYLDHNDKRQILEYKDIFRLIDLLKGEETITNIEFTWHGGEPLLWGLENYNRIFDYQKTNLKNKDFINVFQTNGTLINESIINMLKKYQAYIGVSIDGPSKYDNINRFKNSKDYADCINAINLLRIKNMDFSLFITINENNKKNIDEIFNFIEKSGAYAYNLIPIMSKKYKIDRYEWKQILIKSKEFQNKTGIINGFVKNLDLEKPKMCYLNGMCKVFVTLDSDNNVYKTCQSNNEFLIGNLNDENIIDKIKCYIQKPLDIKEDSIYKRTGKRKYIYFQGNGCIYRKILGDNEDFILGMIDYLNYSDS